MIFSLVGRYAPVTILVTRAVAAGGLGQDRETQRSSLGHACPERSNQFAVFLVALPAPEMVETDPLAGDQPLFWVGGRLTYLIADMTRYTPGNRVPNLLVGTEELGVPTRGNSDEKDDAGGSAEPARTSPDNCADSTVLIAHHRPGDPRHRRWPTTRCATRTTLLRYRPESAPSPAQEYQDSIL